MGERREIRVTEGLLNTVLTFFLLLGSDYFNVGYIVVFYTLQYNNCVCTDIIFLSGKTGN